MIEYFTKHPDKRNTRLLLTLGLITFFIVYFLVLRLIVAMGFETAEFNRVWISFDQQTFKVFIQGLLDAGHRQSFLSSFRLSIISSSGLVLALLATAVIIVRRQQPGSRLHTIGWVVVPAVILFGLLDIIPSLLMLATSQSLPLLPNWLAMVMSGAYLIRVMIMYLIIFWFIFNGIRYLVLRFRRSTAA